MSNGGGAHHDSILIDGGGPHDRTLALSELIGEVRSVGGVWVADPSGNEVLM